MNTLTSFLILAQITNNTANMRTKKSKTSCTLDCFRLQLYMRLHYFKKNHRCSEGLESNNSERLQTQTMSRQGSCLHPRVSSNTCCYSSIRRTVLNHKLRKTRFLEQRLTSGVDSPEKRPLVRNHQDETKNWS